MVERGIWSPTALLALALAACTGTAQSPSNRGAERAPLEVWAFHAPWDPLSDSSAVRHRRYIDVLVSGWIALDTATLRPSLLYRDALIRRDDPSTRSFALVTSWLGEGFHPETIRRLAANDASLARAAGTIAGIADSAGYHGLVLDFELHEPRDLPALLRVVRAIADSTRGRGPTEIAIAVPATDTAAYPTRPLLAIVDHVLPMLYDLHWAGSAPGPVATPQWARRALGTHVSAAGPSRVVAAYPVYGYLWRRAAPDAPAVPLEPARTIGYADALRITSAAGVPLERDPPSSSLRALVPNEWELWVSDAGHVEALIEDARRLGVRRVAFWRLGVEDPAVWPRINPDSAGSSGSREDRVDQGGQSR
ncbi:MAG TPA: hypothetical protein VMM18_01585 [Gemmatimonadaceae bacterium]|nr:hypothetical protein [Gemmatimonadaceae bacterium]